MKPLEFNIKEIRLGLMLELGLGIRVVASVRTYFLH